MRLETFLVRVWTGTDPGAGSSETARQPGLAPEGEAAGPAGLHGVVRHVRTDGERRFVRADDLLAFLADPPALEPDDGPPLAAEPGGPEAVPAA